MTSSVLEEISMLLDLLRGGAGLICLSAMRCFLETEQSDLPLASGHSTWFGRLNNQYSSRLDEFLAFEEWENYVVN